MREFTNLQWPETPFGAEQRPFGRHVDMLAAFTIEWAAGRVTGVQPAAAALVYLRVRRHGPAIGVADDTLSIGFRVAVVDDPTDVPELLMLTDRALTRARRHAAILTGYHLHTDLDRMNALSTVPLRGAAGVLSAWVNRTSKQRGLALMVDTATDVNASSANLDTTIESVDEPVPHCPTGVARRALTRGVAIGLTAAEHTGRYRWEGTFRVAEAVQRAGWDVLADHAEGNQPQRDHSGVSTSRTDDTGGRPLPAP